MLRTVTPGGAHTLENLRSLPERHFRACAATLAVLVILLAWVPRLFRSLWLDETFTYWHVYRGWSRVFQVQALGQSRLYGVLTSLFYFGPGKYMEFWLRLPAVMAMIVAAYFVFRLGEDWFGENAGWMALVLFVSERQIVLHATEARPYPLAMAACLGMLYGLHSWLAKGRRSGWVLFLCGTILVPYTHYLFVAFFVVPAAYLAVRIARRQRVPWIALLGSCLVAFVACLPLRSLLLEVASRGGILSYEPVPTPAEFMVVALPIEVVFSAFIALAVAQLFLTCTYKAPTADAIWMGRVCLFCALAGPAVLFVYSHLKGHGALIERYCLYSVAGLLLPTTYFFMQWNGAGPKLLAMSIFTVIALLHSASHFREDDGWRPISDEMNLLDPAGEAPAFVVSGFVESNSLDWEHALNEDSHLYASLIAYPISREVYPLPKGLDDHARDFASGIINGKLRGRRRIFLVSSVETPLIDWIASRFSDRNYTLRPLRFPGGVLLEFDASESPN